MPAEQLHGQQQDMWSSCRAGKDAGAVFNGHAATAGPTQRYAAAVQEPTQDDCQPHQQQVTGCLLHPLWMLLQTFRQALGPPLSLPAPLPGLVPPSAAPGR